MILPRAEDWLFSVKAFGAAILALGIGFWLDLPQPYWAMATAYIASQSLSGATRSKAAFRASGTVAGGLAALVLVPNLVDAPVLLSMALALWTGLCLFGALLDRTPRSYAFMLAGYTAAIIGFPAVSDPGAIFDTVLARTEEILLGIACASSARICSCCCAVRQWPPGGGAPADRTGPQHCRGPAPRPRHGLAEAAAQYGRGDRNRFTALMLERLGLMAPRVAAVASSSDLQGVDTVAELRTGLNLVELRRGRHGLQPDVRATLERALDAMARYFGDRARTGAALPPAEDMLSRLDTALAAVGCAPPSDARRDALLGLIGVRRGLFPDRPPPALPPPIRPPLQPMPMRSAA